MAKNVDLSRYQLPLGSFYRTTCLCWQGPANTVYDDNQDTRYYDVAEAK